MHEIKKILVSEACPSEFTDSKFNQSRASKSGASTPSPPVINGYVNLEHNLVVAQQHILGLQQWILGL